MVDPAHAGGGSDQLGGDRSDVADGGATVRVADEVHLLRPVMASTCCTCLSSCSPRSSELWVAETWAT